MRSMIFTHPCSQESDFFERDHLRHRAANPRLKTNQLPDNFRLHRLSESRHLL
jgi:hypothetical protein